MDETLIAIARIEAKLDAALALGNDHEERLRVLEGRGGKRWEALIAQMIALVTAAVLGGVLTRL